jgi:hypothetical protein
MASTCFSDDEASAPDHGVAVAVANKTNNNKPKRHTFPRLQKGDSYPFLEDQDKKDLAIFKCLMLSKPFAVGKGKGLTEAWAAAVAEINEQPDVDGSVLFNPPISVKTVRERFDGAMKIIAALDNAVPFRSGNDDEDAPNELRTLCEDLLSIRNSFDTAALEVKDSTVAKKKKDREAAKAIQQAAIGNWVSFNQPTPESDDSAEDSDKKSSVANSTSSSASKRNRVSIGDRADMIKELLEERKANRKAKLEAREEKQQQQHQLMQQQLQVSLQMVAMLKALTDQLNNRNN